MGKISDGGEVSLSYFQRKIATRVLAGYLEDVWFIYIYLLTDLIYAETDEKLVENVDKILNRLREHSISCAPAVSWAQLFCYKVIVFTKINFSEDKWSSFISFCRISNKKLQRFFKASLVTLVAVFGSFLQNFVFTYVSVAVFIRNATSKTS